MLLPDTPLALLALSDLLSSLCRDLEFARQMTSSHSSLVLKMLHTRQPLLSQIFPCLIKTLLFSQVFYGACWDIVSCWLNFRPLPKLWETLFNPFSRVFENLILRWKRTCFEALREEAFSVLVCTVLDQEFAISFLKWIISKPHQMSSTLNLLRFKLCSLWSFRPNMLQVLEATLKTSHPWTSTPLLRTHLTFSSISH